MGPPLTAAHMERLLLLFAVWEGRNGARPEETNVLACRLAAAASKEYLAKLAERHGVDPPAHTRIALSGGSDDHGAIDVATTWTRAPGDSPATFLAAVAEGLGAPQGAHGSTTKLAHALGALAVNAYRQGGHALPPLLAAQARMLFDEDAADAGVRHEEIRAASRQLVRLLGSRVREGGVDLDRLDSVGSRLSALVGAAALQAPYLGTAHHHAGAKADLEAIEDAFFGGRDEAREIRALVFTDTFDEANGVAGTMRRLAAEGARGSLGVQVATARADGADAPGVIAFPPDWTLPLPTYEDLDLRFPLVTDVLARVEELRPDVVHLATPGPVGVCGLVAAKLLDIPVVGSYHTELGPYALHLTRDLLVAQAMDLWVEWFYRQCRTVLAPTHAIADALRARGHADVRVWGRGVDADRFAPHKRSEVIRDQLLGGPGRGGVLLLSVGRLSHEKRVDVLLDAYRRLRERAPDARLAVVGDGPARAELEAAAPDGVRFLGELRGDPLAQVYASADVFCFPSTTDTFGQVMLEAAASGLPVVAAHAGGAAELVRHGVTGLLVTPDDSVALAEALAELVDDGRTRLALGRRGLAAARQRSWARSHDELLAGYAAARGRTAVPQRVAA
jgi:glycosyltransferase involved in cell wall biosynthesis